MGTARPLVLLLLVLLAGCFHAAPPDASRLARLAAATLASGPIAAGQYQIRSRSVESGPGYGTLRLTIIWPDGPGRDLRGYHAQLIPDSTAKISVAVFAKGARVAAADLTREAGQATASATIGLRAYSNVSVIATARSASGEAIAMGTAAGISIVRSRATSVHLTMTSLFVPAIESVTENVGTGGDSVEIRGRLFFLPGRAAPLASLGELPLTIAATSSDPREGDMVTVAIPDDAATGRVVITVDGVSSYSNALFWVATGLGIDAAKAAWDTTREDTRQAVFDEVLTFTATNSWVVPQGVAAGAFGEGPTPSWSSSARSIADFEPGPGLTRRLTMGAVTGATRITARLGGLVSNEINVASGLTGHFHPVARTLTRGRTGATAHAVGQYVYVIGGLEGGSSLRSVERATYDDSFDLGTFSAAGQPQLNVARRTHVSLVVGEHLYVLGGYTDDGPTALVEAAPIDADGVLGQFATASAQLRAERTGHCAVVLGPWVYVVGGIGSGPAVTERARILDAQGNLGAFEPYETASLQVPRYDVACATLGRRLYVIGGSAVEGSVPSAAVEVATFDEAGTLGSFSVTGSLPASASLPMAAGLRDRLLVAGGHAGNFDAPLADLAAGAEDDRGALTFSAVQDFGLAKARHHAASLVLGKWLYLLGGRGAGTDEASIERASIPYGGVGDAEVGVR
ncbi:MAG: hypothetical protein FJZ01_08745 [Candidatus Sericytochromatia bacterium]|nr:hypothetical protein [Candidatus Tanganyikabacteria bacterium]